MFRYLCVQKWHLGDLLEKVLGKTTGSAVPCLGGNYVSSHAEKHTKMLPRVSGLVGGGAIGTGESIVYTRSQACVLRPWALA